MAHIHEKIDFTVEVFILYKNKVLLRMHDKYKIWLSIGGHIELDEDPNQAALREVKEETGLDIILWKGNQKFSGQDEHFTELIPPLFLGRHHVTPTHEHVTFVYFATSTTDVVVPEYESDKSDDWRWVTKEDMQTMDLRSNVKYYAELALDTLGANS